MVRPDGGGTYVRGARSGNSTASVNNPSIIFDANSINTVSNPIQVPSGTAIVLYADSLSEDGESTNILVQRAIMAPGVSLRGGCNNGCGELEVGIASVDMRIPVALGGNQWIITPTQNTVIIPVPGMYTFELTNEAFLGKAVLTFVSMEYKHQLPDVYMLGVTAGVPLS